LFPEPRIAIRGSRLRRAFQADRQSVGMIRRAGIVAPASTLFLENVIRDDMVRDQTQRWYQGALTHRRKSDLYREHLFGMGV
jgi:hypothetical protein